MLVPREPPRGYARELSDHHTEPIDRYRSSLSTSELSVGCFISQSALTNFCEGQNAYLPEGFFDVLRDGNERSQHGFREGYPACGGRVIRCPLFGPYLDNCPDKFDDLLFLNSKFIVP